MLREDDIDQPIRSGQDIPEASAAPEAEGAARGSARARLFELPDLSASLDVGGVTALGDSIVDALTTEFSISEVPAPGVGAKPAESAQSESGDVVADAAAAASKPAPNATEDGATVALPRVNAAGQGTVHGEAPADNAPAAVADDFSEAAAVPAASAVDSQPTQRLSEDDLPDIDEDDAYADWVTGASPETTAVMEPIEAPAAQPEPEGAPRVRRRVPVGKIIAGLCIALVLAVAAYGAHFAWDRWYRYDDAADIQGEWQMTNAQRTMVIDGKNLKISDDVSYEYTLDTKEKTITYTFGNASGTASYRFSDDRKVLVIDENTGTDWMMALHLKDDPVLSTSEVPEGVSKLVKLSDDSSASPKSLDDASDGSEWADDPFLIGGYTELTQTEVVKPATGSSKKDADDEDADESDEQDGDSDDLEEGQDPDADYFDKERALNFYYDDSQMLYYDQYGNYYYDMYGNNPYEAVEEDYYYDDGSYDTGYAQDYYYEETYY